MERSDLEKRSGVMRTADLETGWVFTGWRPVSGVDWIHKCYICTGRYLIKRERRLQIILGWRDANKAVFEPV